MARFVMNAMLASGGYPWTVIRVENRDAYLSALDRASIDLDIAPFSAGSQCGNGRNSSGSTDATTARFTPIPRAEVSTASVSAAWRLIRDEGS
jgi:hypothetical protein